MKYQRKRSPNPKDKGILYKTIWTIKQTNPERMTAKNTK